MNNEKVKSVIAYIFGIIGGLIILLMKDSEKKTKIHAAQSVTISILYYIFIAVSNFIPIQNSYLEYILSGLYFIAIIIGIVNACRDEEPEIPIIGNIATSIFKKQIES